MLRWMLLVVAACSTPITPMTVVATDGHVSALAVDDRAVYWADATSIWSFEEGVAEPLAPAIGVTGIATIDHHVYWSGPGDLQILGADGHWLVTRDAHHVRVYDPRIGAPDWDPHRHEYAIADDECASVGRGAIAIGGPAGLRTIDLASGSMRTYDLGAHAARIVQPVDGGVALVDVAGIVWVDRDSGLEAVADRGHWDLLVDHDGVWAFDGATILRTSDGQTLDMSDPIAAAAPGNGGVFIASGKAIYRVE